MAVYAREDIVQNIALYGTGEVILGFAAIASAGVSAFRAIQTASTASSLGDLVSVFGSFATAAAAATVGLGLWARASEEVINDAGNLAEQLGVSVDESSSFVAALGSLGAHTDTAAAAMRRLAVRVETDWPIIQKSVREAAALIVEDQLKIEQATLAVSQTQLKAASIQTEISEQAIKHRFEGAEAEALAAKDQQAVTAASISVEEARVHVTEANTAAFYAQAEALQKLKDDQLSVQSASLGLEEAQHALRALQDPLGTRISDQATGYEKRITLEKANLAVQEASARLEEARTRQQEDQDNARARAEQVRIDRERAYAELQNAQLGQQEAVRRQEEDAANAQDRVAAAEERRQSLALQAEQNQIEQAHARLEVQQALNKQLEDQANSIEAAVKLVKELASGSNASEGAGAAAVTAKNIIHGLIAEIGSAGAPVDHLVEAIGAVGLASPKLQDFLLRTADLFHNMRDETLKNAVAVELFGRGFDQNFVAVLDQGSAAILRMQQHFKDLGLFFTPEEFAQAREFRVAFAQLETEITLVANKFASLFQPAFTAIMQSLTQALEENKDTILSWGAAIRDTAQPVFIAFLDELTGANLESRIKLNPEQLFKINEWKQTFDTIKGYITEGIAYVKDIIVNDLPPAFEKVQELLENIAAGLNAAFGTHLTGKDVGIGLLIGQFTGLNALVTNSLGLIAAVTAALALVFNPAVAAAFVGLIGGLTTLALGLAGAKAQLFALGGIVAIIFSATPLSRFLTLLGLIGAAIIYIATHTKEIKEAFDEAYNAIRDWSNGVETAMEHIASVIEDKVIGAIKKVTEAVKAAWSAVTGAAQNVQTPGTPAAQSATAAAGEAGGIIPPQLPAPAPPPTPTPPVSEQVQPPQPSAATAPEESSGFAVPASAVGLAAGAGAAGDVGGLIRQFNDGVAKFAALVQSYVPEALKGSASTTDSGPQATVAAATQTKEAATALKEAAAALSSAAPQKSSGASASGSSTTSTTPAGGQSVAASEANAAVVAAAPPSPPIPAAGTGVAVSPDRALDEAANPPTTEFPETVTSNVIDLNRRLDRDYLGENAERVQRGYPEAFPPPGPNPVYGSAPVVREPLPRGFGVSGGYEPPPQGSPGDVVGGRDFQSGWYPGEEGLGGATLYSSYSDQRVRRNPKTGKPELVKASTTTGGIDFRPGNSVYENTEAGIGAVTLSQRQSPLWGDAATWRNYDRGTITVGVTRKQEYEDPRERQERIDDGGYANPDQLYADGGMIWGYGTSTSDSNVIRASQGEYIVKARAVKDWGGSFMDSVNRGDRSGVIRHLADGGGVDSDTDDLGLPGLQGADEAPQDSRAYVADPSKPLLGRVLTGAALAVGDTIGGIAQGAYNAVTLPGDVALGKVRPDSPEGISRAVDLAGLATLPAAAPELPAADTLGTFAGAFPRVPDEKRVPDPIIAYHGTPHDFDRFDVSKIGVGEGTQDEGHGLYFAQEEKVAKKYRETLARPKATVGEEEFDPGNPEHRAAETVTVDHDGDIDAAIGWRQGRLNELRKALINDSVGEDRSDYIIKKYEFDKAVLDRLRQGNLPEYKEEPGGHVYQTAIHAYPDDFLEWNTPLNQQHYQVQDALKESGILDRVAHLKDPTGADLYRELAFQAAPPEAFDKALQTVKDNGFDIDEHELENAKDHVAREHSHLAAQKLREAGIPGTKYPDDLTEKKIAEGKLKPWQGTRNYVTFTDDIVEILKKYGLAGIGLGGAGAAATDLATQPDQTSASTPGLASGGYVDARVSDGEYVVAPEAVKHWGSSFLDRLNQSGGASAGKGPRNVEAQSYGEARTWAEGGKIEGPGTSTSDSIPMRLPEGSYVVRAAAVDAVGEHTLDAINQGMPPKSMRYDDGGQVLQDSGTEATDERSGMRFATGGFAIIEETHKGLIPALKGAYDAFKNSPAREGAKLEADTELPHSGTFKTRLPSVSGMFAGGGLVGGLSRLMRRSMSIPTYDSGGIVDAPMTSLLNSATWGGPSLAANNDESSRPTRTFTLQIGTGKHQVWGDKEVVDSIERASAAAAIKTIGRKASYVGS